MLENPVDLWPLLGVGPPVGLRGEGVAELAVARGADGARPAGQAALSGSPNCSSLTGRT